MMEFVSKPKNPCGQDCPYREAFCKRYCEDYIEYEEKYKLYREFRQKNRDKDSDYFWYRKMLDKKIKRRLKRHG